MVLSTSLLTALPKHTRNCIGIQSLEHIYYKLSRHGASCQQLCIVSKKQYSCTTARWLVILSRTGCGSGERSWPNGRITSNKLYEWRLISGGGAQSQGSSSDNTAACFTGEGMGSSELIYPRLRRRSTICWRCQMWCCRWCQRGVQQNFATRILKHFNPKFTVASALKADDPWLKDSDNIVLQIIDQMMQNLTKLQLVGADRARQCSTPPSSFSAALNLSGQPTSPSASAPGSITGWFWQYQAAGWQCSSALAVRQLSWRWQLFDRSLDKTLVSANHPWPLQQI